MPIPQFQKILRPMLARLADGREHSFSEVCDDLAREFELTEAERAEMLPSGRQGRFENRCAWVKLHLKSARLIEAPSKGQIAITERGRQALVEYPTNLGINDLQQFEEYRAFRERSNRRVKRGDDAREAVTTDRQTLVRAPYFKTYSKSREVIRTLDGVPRAHVMELFRQLDEHIGTPQQQSDWKNPDEWIPAWMSGNARALATRLWNETTPRVNPRHMRGAFLFAVNHGLIALDEDGTYHATEEGRAFLRKEPEILHRLDHLEGLAELLRLVARTKPARRATLLPGWTEFLKAYSKFQSSRSIDAALRERLLDLRDRGLIEQHGTEYAVTDAGRHYLSEQPRFDLPAPLAASDVDLTPDEEESPGPAVQESNPDVSLASIADRTGLPEPLLTRWVSAINRKGQAILYGPPGTGKTFVAQHLAEHLVGGGSGIAELVQFHPAYSYEDFVLGIRPQSTGGALSYPLVPGRFLDFCERASQRDGLSVLIIDEINRANLARVFGELMYLLEYRDRDVPLAGGRVFRIPSNVRLIGTMNTADRSIALVDHALRRRFAFLELKPSYETLQRYHARNGSTTVAENLIRVLKRLNTDIDDAHYEIGISFFMVKELAPTLPDIWQMEIEPYLQEYFFDQKGSVDKYRWGNLEAEILGER